MKKMGLLAVLFAVVFLVGIGCVSFAPLVSEIEKFEMSDQIDLKFTKPDILDTAVEVGQGLGLKLVIKGIKEVVLKSETPFLTQGVSPKFTFKVIKIEKSNDKTIKITVYTKGNFGTGGQKATEELLREFKIKLLEKLNQN